MLCFFVFLHILVLKVARLIKELDENDYILAFINYLIY